MRPAWAKRAQPARQPRAVANEAQRRRARRTPRAPRGRSSAPAPTTSRAVAARRRQRRGPRAGAASRCATTKRRAQLRARRIGSRSRQPLGQPRRPTRKPSEDAGRHLHEERGVAEEAERRAPAPGEDARRLAHRVEERAAAEGDVVRGLELLVLEGRDGLGRERQQRGRSASVSAGKSEAGDDQRVQRAVGRGGAAPSSAKPSSGVDQQHVARPEQHRMDQADRRAGTASRRA